MTYKERYLNCKNKEEFKQKVADDIAFALAFNKDRLKFVENAVNEVCQIHEDWSDEECQELQFRPLAGLKSALSWLLELKDYGVFITMKIIRKVEEGHIIWICPYCGKKIMEGIICEHCGKEIEF